MKFEVKNPVMVKAVQSLIKLTVVPDLAKENLDIQTLTTNDVKNLKLVIPLDYNDTREEKAVLWGTIGSIELGLCDGVWVCRSNGLFAEIQPELFLSLGLLKFYCESCGAITL